MSSNPYSSNFQYKKYSLEQLDNWVNDALNCEDLTPEDIYDTILKCVDESVEYHKTYLTKSIELLSLLKGHRSFEIDTSLDDIDASYNAAIKERAYYEGWDYTATGEKFPRVCDKDDPSPECKSAWTSFWEEQYYPEEYYPHPDQKQYTEEEMNAMCEQAASEVEKEKCREYNLREAEYYNKRAKLDAEYQTKADGYSVDGEEHSKYYYDYNRNDSNRENPFKDKVKKWVLPVEEVENGDTMETEYFITFPDDLLEAANLKEGDTIEWIDRGDGSYEMRKVTRPLQMDEC
jgi:hypothetical protein